MTPLPPVTYSLRRSFVSPFPALLLGALLACGLLAAAPPALADEDEEPQAAATAPSAADEDTDTRNPAESARIRFLEGDLKIERSDNDQVELGSLNAPVFAGDTVTTARGRAEVQLSTGTLVRIDENSRVNFLSLPGGDGDVDTVVQVAEGSASVEVHGALSRRKDFRVDTQSASVYLLANGRYRIDVEGKYKKTRASAFRGVAEVVGDEGSVILRSGQRTLVGESGEPDPSRTFNTAAADEFDGWVQDRSEHYRVASSGSGYGSNTGSGGGYESGGDTGNGGPDDSYAPDAETLPEEVRPYSSELSYYGSWNNIAPYGWCWTPGGVSAGWRPYYNGYWTYGPGGNFWVSYDAWGWAPYHYGRWIFSTGHWCWVPGGVFAPAWVSWYYGPSYFGWCPLDYWNYPCALHYGYVGYDFHCWNFVGYHNIYHRNVRRVYATPTAVKVDLNKGVVVRGRPVPIHPGDVRAGRIPTPQILQKARDMKLSRIDVNSERVAKRSFRDGERAQAAGRSSEMKRLSPTPEGRRPSTRSTPSQSDAKGRSGSREPQRDGRAPAERGGGRDGSPSKPRPVSPDAPRLHGAGKPSDDKNRGGHGSGGNGGGHGDGGGHKPSSRAYTNDDFLPRYPRPESGPRRGRSVDGSDRGLPSRPRGEPGEAPRFRDRDPSGRGYDARGMDRGGRGPEAGRRSMDSFRQPDRSGGAPRMPQGQRSQPQAQAPRFQQQMPRYQAPSPRAEGRPSSSSGFHQAPGRPSSPPSSSRGNQDKKHH